MSLQLPDRVSWLIDLRATGYGLGMLGEFLEATEIVGHNVKFDALWLARRRLRPARGIRQFDRAGCGTAGFSRLASIGDPRGGSASWEASPGRYRNAVNLV